MNFKSNCQIAIIALLGLACSAQSRSIAHLLEGIRNGDIASIYDAGRTGDPTFTPVLRDRLKQSDRDSERDALKMAFAKLGDTHELQLFYCEARESFGLHISTRALEYIGGGYSIRVWAALMALDPEFEKAKLPDSFDVRSDPPSWLALHELPRIVPNPPIKRGSPSSLEEHAEAVQQWRAWIDSHSDEIDHLQPNGKGVIFSKSACRGMKRSR